jgi:hypothetical protein
VIESVLRPDGSVPGRGIRRTLAQNRTFVVAHVRLIRSKYTARVSKGLGRYGASKAGGLIAPKVPVTPNS